MSSAPASKHHFAGQAGMLLMGMMQKLRATLGAGEHALLYLQMHEDTFTGRGFPQLSPRTDRSNTAYQ